MGGPRAGGGGTPGTPIMGYHKIIDAHMLCFVKNMFIRLKADPVAQNVLICDVKHDVDGTASHVAEHYFC